MKIRKVVTGVVVLLVVVAVMLAGTERISRAQSEEQNVEVMAKLDDVLKGQQDVIKRLEELKNEMKILKIRVTQMQ